MSRLIDDAAAVLGKTRTEFMVESARRQAVDVLLDQRLFTLDSERYDAFMQALEKEVHATAERVLDAAPPTH